MTETPADEDWTKAVAAMRRGKFGDARIYALWAGSKAFDAGVARSSAPAAPSMTTGVHGTGLVDWWHEGWQMAEDVQARNAAVEAELAMARHRPVRMPYAEG